jgi:hypothetical protein
MQLIAHTIKHSADESSTTLETYNIFESDPKLDTTIPFPSHSAYVEIKESLDCCF